MPELSTLLRPDVTTGAILTDIDPRSTPGIAGRKAAEAEMPALADRLDELQERLWVEGTRSLLVVLQGMDTSGKGGTVRHVFSAMNPAGLEVASFKKPTEEELAHHFLWRIERELPAPGEVVVFDRSHYEDVLVVRVRSLVPEEVWRERYGEIAEFEQRVAAGSTTIVKCMLHISYDEQRERLLARLDDPAKHWKFNEQDIEERARWQQYMAAYEDAIRECSSDVAPWHVVPADRKWYRNWAISTLLVQTLERLDPEFPTPDLDVASLRERLQPPN
ncbi:MAG: polyphosphate kinase 2 family protein [Actinomycetota bacterium]|nr:polyphosphate kinase 2 family protein [Actinomycetota bacterium]